MTKRTITNSGDVEQQSIPFMAGVGAQKYALMGGRNYQPKRNPDGSIADSSGAGAYPPDSPSGPAFQSGPEAFPPS